MNKSCIARDTLMQQRSKFHKAYFNVVCHNTLINNIFDKLPTQIFGYFSSAIISYRICDDTIELVILFRWLRPLTLDVSHSIMNNSRQSVLLGSVCVCGGWNCMVNHNNQLVNIIIYHRVDHSEGNSNGNTVE